MGKSAIFSSMTIKEMLDVWRKQSKDKPLPPPRSYPHFSLPEDYPSHIMGVPPYPKFRGLSDAQRNLLHTTDLVVGEKWEIDRQFHQRRYHDRLRFCGYLDLTGASSTFPMVYESFSKRLECTVSLEGFDPIDPGQPECQNWFNVLAIAALRNEPPRYVKALLDRRAAEWADRYARSMRADYGLMSRKAMLGEIGVVNPPKMEFTKFLSDMVSETARNMGLPKEAISKIEPQNDHKTPERSEP